MHHKFMIVPELLTFGRKGHLPNREANLTNKKGSKGREVNCMLNDVGEVIDSSQCENIKNKTQDENRQGDQHRVVLVELQKAIFVF